MPTVQVIKGKKLFVIIETMHKTSEISEAHDIDELNWFLGKNALLHNKNTIELIAINTSDREVKRLQNKYYNH